LVDVRLREDGVPVDTSTSREELADPIMWLPEMEEVVFEGIDDDWLGFEGVTRSF
jgi:hypothetical protein